ncbi:divergent polysaccharide deacetylase family protein [Pelagibius sp. 7325]|uniref:divergent polysaccharide deacetylase family protein n=1 Tax=Pelagibius sp. 7325 TaxID=3131994 RepID=UPI0030EDFF3B
MTKRESHKPAGIRRRPRGEALWNAAAIAGLLAIGLLLGGVAGVYLDRQGILGAPPPQIAEPAPATAPVPRPEPRIMAAGPQVDREALEVQYHEALRQQQEATALRNTTPNAESGWQGDGPLGGESQTTLAPSLAPAPALAPALPVVPHDGPALWQQNAIAVAPAAGKPMIAIVLDDVGVNRRGALNAIELPAPLTLAFMTYADGLAKMTAEARDHGHELMLHVPMQPMSETMDPGPNVLRDDLPAAELVQRLGWGLARFDGYVGVNNHMGSRFTASPEGMALVMRELKARGLLFLDSLTAGNSVAGEAAARSGVPYAVRDVFLDNEPDDLAAIHRQLAILEQTARQRGYAIGIGHPHDGTVTALQQWIPEMRARGFALVPISAIVRHRQQLAAQHMAGAG